MIMMKSLRYITALCALVALGACTQDLTNVELGDNTASSHKIVNTSTEANRGSILVRFAPEAESRLGEVATRTAATRTGVVGVDALLDEVGGYSVEPIFVVTEKNREKVHAMGLHLWYELFFDNEADLDKVALRLAEVAEVAVVQFSQNIKRVAKPITISARDVATRAATPQSNIPFNDPERHYQWHYDNLGYGKCAVTGSVSTGGLAKSRAVEGADVNAVAAWKLCAGDPSIIVAVSDEGVCNEHEDLRENIWVNTKEIAGNGVDDDNNGFIDDVYGYNFAQRKATITWNNRNDTGHGSHVAGTVAAVNNNGIGVCGIAGGSGKGDGVRIMSAQIFAGDVTTSTSQTAKSIQYAADNGAVIMQCSWGFGTGQIMTDTQFGSQVRAERDAIDYFVANAGGENSPIDGGLVIFAAGNSIGNVAEYPGAYKKCVSVSAFAPSLKPAYYTNYGPGVDIAAPGGDQFYDWEGCILSTTPNINLTEGLYSYMQGTSMACPHVSGVAALGLSYAKKLGKKFTAEEFRSMLLTAVNDINPYMTGGISFTDEEGSHTLNYPDYANQMGAGYVDALKLLLQVEGTPYTTVVAGKESVIDITPYFGDGTTAIKLQLVTISDEDKQALDVTVTKLENNTIRFKCNKIGSAEVTVQAIVGGTSTSSNSQPSGVSVTKKLVIISRANATSNGWL